MNRAAAVTWWAHWPLDVCEPFCRQTAHPSVVTLAEVITYVHLLPSSQSPINFNMAISMCRPPISITYRHVHWIFLAIAYIGWSTVNTGIWPGLTRTVICWMIFIPCLTIAGECAPSRNSGSSEMIAGDLGTDTCELAKWADHDTFMSTRSGSVSLAKAVVTLSNQGIFIWSLAGSETGGTFVYDSGDSLIDFHLSSVFGTLLKVSSKTRITVCGMLCDWYCCAMERITTWNRRRVMIYVIQLWTVQLWRSTGRHCRRSHTCRLF